MNLLWADIFPHILLSKCVLKISNVNYASIGKKLGNRNTEVIRQKTDDKILLNSDLRALMSEVGRPINRRVLADPYYHCGY